MQEANPAHEGVAPPRRMLALDNAKGFSLDFVFINLNQQSTRQAFMLCLSVRLFKTKVQTKLEKPQHLNYFFHLFHLKC